jgi:hypothetical protein
MRRDVSLSLVGQHPPGPALKTREMIEALARALGDVTIHAKPPGWDHPWEVTTFRGASYLVGRGRTLRAAVSDLARQVVLR